MILQRYTFGSKSQLTLLCNYRFTRCLWYCKDIHLEANHNIGIYTYMNKLLLMILQRYTFGSKSQRSAYNDCSGGCCLWYCKDIHLEANHNYENTGTKLNKVAYDIAKIYIWKQITTQNFISLEDYELLMILQRYTFGSKSQLFEIPASFKFCCLWYCKDIHLEANHNWSCKRLAYNWLLMILQRYTFGSKSQHA